jgi:hypothetical protein
LRIGRLSGIVLILQNLIIPNVTGRKGKMAVEVIEITTRYEKSGHLPALMYRNLLSLCQFFVAGAAASAFAGSFFEQQGFLTSFLHFMALGQSFAIAPFFAQQAFLQSFLHSIALGQSFFMFAIFLQSAFLSAMALGQSFAIAPFFAQQAFLQSFLHFMALGQSFFMSAIFLQHAFLFAMPFGQSFLQSFLQFSFC